MASPAPQAPVDPTVIVAIVSSIGIVFSALIAGFVAIFTNRTEKQGTASTAVDKATERSREEKEQAMTALLELRDAQIEDRDDKIAELVSEQAEHRAEIARLQREGRSHLSEIARLESRNLELDAEIAELRKQP